MKQKKITIIISYDYEEKNTICNDKIAQRIYSDLKKGSNPRHERIENIIVEDNGTGIHQEDIHNIFKRFYRSRYSQDTHGIGLGLPLAKSIVEAHQGTVSVTSRVGRGSRFVLSFFHLTKE